MKELYQKYAEIKYLIAKKVYKIRFIRFLFNINSYTYKIYFVLTFLKNMEMDNKNKDDSIIA